MGWLEGEVGSVRRGGASARRGVGLGGSRGSILGWGSMWERGVPLWVGGGEGKLQNPNT